MLYNTYNEKVVIFMDFDFKAINEEEKVEGFSKNIFILILSLLGMFVLPSVVAIALLIVLPQNIDVTFWSYIAQLLGYGLYVFLLFMYLGKDKVKININDTTYIMQLVLYLLLLLILQVYLQVL